MSITAASALLATTLALSGGFTAWAQSPGYTLNGVAESSGTYTLGNVFTVGPQNVTVNSLGYYDSGRDGFAGSHDLGILDNNGNIVSGSAITIGSGTTGTLIGNYRYVNLNTPITLLANQTYTVAGTPNGGDAFDYVDGSGVVNDNRIGYITSEFNQVNDLSTALTDHATNIAAYGGANLLFSGAQYAELSVQNSGFEDNAGLFTSSQGYANDGTNPGIAGWTSNNSNSGLNGPSTSVGNTFGNGSDLIPDGGTYAFLQSVNGATTSITQSIAGFVTGHQYAVTFYTGIRDSTEDPTLVATLDGTTIYSSAVPVTTINGINDYTFASSSIYTATSSGSLDLTFAATDLNTGPTSANEGTALLDKIRVVDVTPTGTSSAPEPGALALLVGGVGLLPVSLRRRRTAKNLAIRG